MKICRAAWAVLACSLSAPVLVGQEKLLDRFPLILQAGLADRRLAVERGWLPDLPFDPQQGYGYSGGEAGSRSRTRVEGGPAAGDAGPGQGGGDGSRAASQQAGWPATWRENPRKYSFHVPNQEYLLRLSFVETDAAAAGLRVFDVYAEDREFFTGLDIYREAGDFRWLTIEGLVSVQDGWLDLRFAPTEKPRPPRISRLEIFPAAGILPAAAAEGGENAALPVPALEVRGDFRRNVLTWPAAAAAGIAGYGVYRSPAPEGPFESLTEFPVLAPPYMDRNLPPGQRWHYRLRAFGVRGGQSALSPPAAGETLSQLPGSIRLFELAIPPVDLQRLGDRRTPAPETPGELLYYGGRYPVAVTAFTDAASWQERKSYRVRLEGGKRVFGNSELVFLAEAGDATFLREKLYCDVQAGLELAAPQANYVHLLLNGDYLGVYLERESLGSGFRSRARLDRVGDFARIDFAATRKLEWKPYGEELEGNNSLWSLNHFFHELHRLNEGEMEGYFAERLYLDRYLRRLAASAVCGRILGAEEPQVYLGDSRNGKWEVFPERSPEGAFGITLFQEAQAAGNAAEAPEQALENARAALLGFGVHGKLLPDPRWRLLETRFLNVPAYWRAYLDEVARVYRELLPAEKFAAILGEALKSRAPWKPADSDARSFGAFFEAHRQAVLGLVEEENVRADDPLALNEFLLRPKAGPNAGAAWVEIANRSNRPVDLGVYRLSTDLDRPGAWSFSARTLAPGELHVAAIADAAFAPSPQGGLILLSRDAGRGRFQAAGMAGYGHQTEGFSYGRTRQGWGFFAAPTPGAANPGEALAPPAWRYRQGIVAEKSGDFTVWVAPASQPGYPAAKEITLYLHFPGESAYQAIPLRWDDKAFRHEVTVKQVENNPRMAYFFLARTEEGIERPYPLAGGDLPLYIPSKPKLFLNEVLPRPARENTLGEFIEIYNGGDEPASIEGLFLTDTQRNPAKWRISRTEPIPPRGFAVLYADGLGTGDHASFKLSNSGEYLGLFHRLEEGNILIDQMAFTAVPMDKSYGRGRDGEKGFQVWKDPTPGKRNLPRIPEEYLKAQRENQGKEGAPPPEPNPPGTPAGNPPKEKDGEKPGKESGKPAGKGPDPLPERPPDPSPRKPL